MPQKEFALRKRIAPSVPLEISFADGNGSFRRTFRVAFDLNVLADISEKTGLVALGYDIWLQVNARMLRVMLWAALLPEQKWLDTRDHAGKRTDEGLERVGSWLTPENQEKAVQALFEAFLLYLPADQAELLRSEKEKATAPLVAGTEQSPSAEIPAEQTRSIAAAEKI